jgi:hypothetical protein
MTYDEYLEWALTEFDKATSSANKSKTNSEYEGKTE